MTSVFLTGVTGFIGSELAERLHIAGYDVTGLVRYNTTRKINVPYNIVYGDLCDHSFIRKTLKLLQPEIIVHLGAASPVEYSFERPIEVTETNYVATINLVEAAKDLDSLKHFIAVSTSETYGIQDSNSIPIHEYAPLRPNTPYAIAKAAAEHYIKNYLSGSIDFSIAKPFNSYGRKNTNRFVVESLITKMLLNKESITAGDPNPIRDFLYVDDHVDAYMALIEAGPQQQVINFCTGRGVSISELQSIIASIMNWHGEVQWNKTYQRPTDCGPLIGNPNLAAYRLNWKAEYTLEEGLKHTIEYWRNKI